MVYDELHAMAAAHMRDERPGHTLQPTALVNEAYLRLTGGNAAAWDGRAHFFSAAAEVMRRILVDHARARLTAKRGGGHRRTPLEEVIAWSDEQVDEVIAVDGGVEALRTHDPRKADVLMLRFFGGLEVEQIGEILGISPRTVKRDWRYARAWLCRELAGG